MTMNKREASQFSSHPTSLGSYVCMSSFRLFEKALSWLFASDKLLYALDPEAASATWHNDAPSLLEFARSYRNHFAQKQIICRVTNKQEDVEASLALIESLPRYIKNPEHLMLASDEILAKVVSYRRLKTGQPLKLPYLTDQGTIEYASYKVDTSFHLFNRMEAFALLNVDKEKGCPVILFRGTDFSIVREEGRRSILSDIDPKGPGHSQFEKLKKGLNLYLEKVHATYGDIRLIGHSLGGSMLLYTLITHPQWLHKDPAFPSVAFNFPGVSKALLKKYEALAEGEKPAFKGFVCQGDVISKFGFLLDPVYALNIGLELSPIRAHEELFFLNHHVMMQKVNLALENSSHARGQYSNLHKQASSFLYELGLKSVFTR